MYFPRPHSATVIHITVTPNLPKLGQVQLCLLPQSAIQADVLSHFCVLAHTKLHSSMHTKVNPDLPHHGKTQLCLLPWFTIQADVLSHSGVFAQTTPSWCDCRRPTVKPSWTVDAVTLTLGLQTWKKQQLLSFCILHSNHKLYICQSHSLGWERLLFCYHFIYYGFWLCAYSSIGQTILDYLPQ